MRIYVEYAPYAYKTTDYHRTIETYLIKKAGFSKMKARTGAVTFIQRFGSSLNLNVHFHMLFLDGVYIDDKNCVF